MAFLPLLFVLVQSLIQFPQPAGDGLDEATHRRMQERQELLEHEMTRLLQELEQGLPEQQDEGWGAVLFGALQQWPFWLLAGFLLVLGLCFSRRTRSREASSSGKDLSSCRTLRKERGEEKQEEDSFYSKEGGEETWRRMKDGVIGIVPGDNTAQAKEEESGNVAANTEGLDEASEGGKTRMCRWSKTRTLERKKKDVEMKEKAAVRI
ncbi:hypothetical protein DUI87_09583 [Hirundo rustica rustica]|uniref:Resistance to inhibitors of cholinesterase protein 3 N-terminal domain-containing protein n=1 Tax=Hirundo rustica rustica TaxID=333673 RepID=A0A3M0L5E0_HIRRU|nr:hypothetical protein DUI87_09583 [Hirundo rustica rustica]